MRSRFKICSQIATSLRSFHERADALPATFNPFQLGRAYRELTEQRGRRFQLPRSPKIIAGLVMLAAFIILAIVGPIVAPYDPSASLSTTNGTPQPPSGAHWLGTTQTQQDVFSQLLAGGRSTILVAVLAVVAATVLSVVIGICAGYLHGRFADERRFFAAFFAGARLTDRLFVVRLAAFLAGARLADRFFVVRFAAFRAGARFTALRAVRLAAFFAGARFLAAFLAGALLFAATATGAPP